MRLSNLKRTTKLFVFYPKTFVNACVLAYKEVRRHPLTALADSYGSDKGFQRHLYTRIYGDILKDKNINSILEIGLLQKKAQGRLGGEEITSAPSLDMWKEYFSNSEVYGFDIEDFSSAKGNWNGIIRGDQSKREDLDKVKNLNVRFDLIIDDALHAAYHQQVSFSYLFELLSPGGMYIIEDLHIRPPEEEEYPPVMNSLELLKRLSEEKKWESTLSTEKECEYIQNNVERVEFFDSITKGKKSAAAMAVIHKKQ